MAHAIPTIPAFTSRNPASVLAQLGDTVLGTAHRLRRAWRIRQDLIAVESLDDATLADIGIGRGEAEGAVRYGRWSRRPATMTTRRAASPVPAVPSSWTEWR